MVTVLPSGQLEFKMFAPQAASVEVVGSFTGWTARPVALDRTGEGWWVVRVAVAPGDHDFQYRIDGQAMMADYAAHGVKLNRWGQWVSRLAVPRPAA